MNIYEKYDNLKLYLSQLENVVIAFSGGVDSTFLLKTAHDILGDMAVAVTARSQSFPQRELNETLNFCEKENIRHIICESEELSIEGFAMNPPNRCYLCKNELYAKIWDVARSLGIKHVAEGSNIDDLGDYRPGLTAIKEQNVKSPLRDAQFSKKEIRILSKELGLNTWNKQSFACLFSRIPYGTLITPETLTMIDKSEQYLLDLGFHQVRVRCHGNLARIETDAEGLDILTDEILREKIYTDFKRLGFTYITIDLLGYRTGSMNEVLNV
ncbi:MAG: ATP-dependent sacrificial sulfur transferase LarE [Syntrophomonadaceae bacterium]|jgi:uncharacterized protein|nr:ATP-dependent sacrificial sulfur transferase LarE [Syntrophomonadaceae bacterium]